MKHPDCEERCQIAEHKGYQPCQGFCGYDQSAARRPIKAFITKGIADSKEDIVLQPLACDVKGAKKFNGQQCVIARAFTRTMKPQAVAVGRSMAFAVFDGLAVRFRIPAASKTLIEEFDSKGRVRKAPITLAKVHPSWKLGAPQKPRLKPDRPTVSKRKRMKKYGVRATGGGVAL